MRRLRMLGFAVLGVLMAAITAVAQPATTAAESAVSYKGYVAIAAGIGFAIAVFGGAMGQSRIGAAACEGAARVEFICKAPSMKNTNGRAAETLGAA